MRRICDTHRLCYTIQGWAFFQEFNQIRYLKTTDHNEKKKKHSCRLYKPTMSNTHFDYGVSVLMKITKVLQTTCMLCGFFKATPAVQFRLAYRNYFQTLSSFSSQNYHTSHIRECSEDSTSYFGGLLCTSQKPPKHEETVALLHYYLLVLINIVKMK